MINFFNEANNIKDELIEIRRDIHKHPELGFEEERTSKLIKEFLTNEKIPYIETAITGICGIIKGEKQGKEKVVALRSDMDALPLKEKNDVPYKSVNDGKMHACGHDGHVAILLGAAKILNKHKSEFSGTIKLFFEPAEETVGGAPFMIKDGVLENPKVDMVVGLHVNEDVETGKIMIKTGAVNAASNPFKIKIKGKGGHGACPDTTHDPIVTAASVITEIQKIVSREVHPANPAVITVGTIHSGTAKNIISDEAEISGIIRTVNRNDRIFVKKRLREIVEGICKINRCKAEVIIEEGYPSLINDDEVVNRVIESAKTVIGEKNIKKQKENSMGVESFAYFAMERPSAFYYLGTGNKFKNTDKPAHGNYFNIDEDAIPIGVGIQCTVCYDYLTSN